MNSTQRFVSVLVVVVSAALSGGCSAGSDAASTNSSADFASYAECMKSNGCTDVPSCPTGATSSTCREEADSDGRLITIWSCPSATWPTTCVLPSGDRLSL
jgi:hypothetical protein